MTPMALGSNDYRSAQTEISNDNLTVRTFFRFVRAIHEYACDARNQKLQIDGINTCSLPSARIKLPLF